MDKFDISELQNQERWTGLLPEHYHMMFVLDCMNKYIDMGLVEGDKFEFTKYGKDKLYKWIKENGHPTKEQINAAVERLFEPSGSYYFRIR
jgi:hypothetical protein